MRRSLTFLAAAACAAVAAGQASFECAPLGPLPGDPTANCEGVASDNQVSSTGVSATSSCGFPTQGLQYLLVTASGPLTSPPPGGPIPRPIAAAASEVRIPIPVGATMVSFDWEFFNSEGNPSASFNDGISIDVVGASGNLVGALVYADTNNPAGTCNHASGGTERAPAAAPQNLLATLPPHAPCDYISIVVWNGGDNAVASRGCVDNVLFDSVVPGCAVPCFGVSPALMLSSPGGFGCLQANLSGLPPGGTYFLAATLNPPPGWLYGVNIGIPELVSQVNAGYPFWGPLSTGGCAGTAQIGQFCSLPSGLTLYMVGLGLPTVGLNGPVTAHTPAVTFTIP
jgi:hypothetical protein